MLHLNPQLLRAWERASLVPCAETYSFQQLGQLRKLRDLRAMRMSAAKIRESVEAMRSVTGVANPLLETGTVCSGSRPAFRHSGSMMEPIARQFLFDFATNTQPQESIAPAAAAPNREAHISALFYEAVQLEGAGRIPEAVEVYRNILGTDSNHAPACINLGTIRYNQQKFVIAEELYRRATQADPDYALAWFDLGNALDELQRLADAIEAYRSAVRLVPGYADAHYNLALAFERTGERRKALCHWTAYLKLDNSGPWADHARSQARRILDLERLAIVHRSPRGGAPRPIRSVPQLKLAPPAAI